MADYYETLGVGADASPEVIQRVYRQLAKAYHPDTNPDNPAGAEKLKNFSEAYETLKDPAKRQRYDRKLSLGTAGASRARSRPPEQKRAARHEAEQASRRRAEEERRQRDLRAMNPISRWLKTPPAGASEHSERVPRARAGLERQVRILRREYPEQIGLLRKARDPLLDGFFQQCLLLTHAAAECVAAYVSAEEGSIAGLIDARVAHMVTAARGAEARSAKQNRRA